MIFIYIIFMHFIIYKKKIGNFKKNKEKTDIEKKYAIFKQKKIWKFFYLIIKKVKNLK